jgi:aminoglycoside 2''-phosphotransferase
LTADDAASAVRTCFDGPGDPVVRRAGEGDYCHAFAVDRDWIFLFARTDEASASLERLAAAAPLVAPHLPVRVPVPLHVGRFGDLRRTFVGYRRIDGQPLGDGLDDEVRGRCVDDLARFVRALQRIDVATVTAAGVPVCEYAFAATEDELRVGSAELEYGRDLDALSRQAGLPASLRARLERALTEHLASPGYAPALLHGELSGEHILVDARTGSLTGVIDLTGMIVGDPARELLYLYEEPGPAFVELLLARGVGDAEPREVLVRLRFLRLWHTALRWLWLSERGYHEPAAGRLAELQTLAA